MAASKGPSDTSWEYRELVIPLDIRVANEDYPTRQQLAQFQGYDGILLKYLGQAAQGAWHPDEPADWDSLRAAGRFASHVETSPKETDPPTTIYTSVSIQLKRRADQDN
jgi:hypothetical protein